MKNQRFKEVGNQVGKLTQNVIGISHTLGSLKDQIRNVTNNMTVIGGEISNLLHHTSDTINLGNSTKSLFNNLFLEQELNTRQGVVRNTVYNQHNSNIKPCITIKDNIRDEIIKQSRVPLFLITCDADEEEFDSKGYYRVFDFNNLYVVVDPTSVELVLVMRVELSKLLEMSIPEVPKLIENIETLYHYFNFIHLKFRGGWNTINTTIGQIGIRYMNSNRDEENEIFDENQIINIPTATNDLQVLFEINGTVYVIPYGVLLVAKSGLLGNKKAITITCNGLDYKINKYYDNNVAIYYFRYTYNGLPYEFGIPLEVATYGDELLEKVHISEGSINNYRTNALAVTWITTASYLNNNQIYITKEVITAIDEKLGLGLLETELSEIH